MIEETIDFILGTIPAVCDEGWLCDAEHYFCDHKAWQKSAAFIRDDPRCLLEMKSLVSEDIDSLHELRTIQKEIWAQLGWPYFQSHSIVFYKQASVLRFRTMRENKKSCLTGRMIVAGDHYHELAARWCVRMRGSQTDWQFSDAPFSVDFTDLDEAFQAREPLRTSLRELVLNQRSAAVSKITHALQAISEYTTEGKKELSNCPKTRDAIMFNFQQLSSAIEVLSPKYTGLRTCRKPLQKVLNQYRREYFGDPDAIWQIISNDLPDLKAILER